MIIGSDDFKKKFNDKEVLDKPKNRVILILYLRKTLVLMISRLGLIEFLKIRPKIISMKNSIMF